MKAPLLPRLFPLLLVLLLPFTAAVSRGGGPDDPVGNGFDETLTFDDNRIPEGWTLSFLPESPGTNAQVANQRFQIGQIDTYAMLEREKAVPAAAAQVEVSFRCELQDIYWGGGYQLHLLMEGGSDFIVLLGKVGDGIEQTRISAGHSTAYEFDRYYSPEYGIYSVDAIFRDGTMHITIMKEGSGVTLADQEIQVAGLTINQLQTVRLLGIMTTGGPGWIDDVVMTATSALPTPTPSPSVTPKFDEHLSFDDNQIPDGWSLNYIAGPGRNAAFVNQRFQIEQVDTYAALDKDKVLPAGANEIQISLRGEVQDTYWGMGYQVHLLMQDGSDFMVNLGKKGFGLEKMSASAGNAAAPEYEQDHDPNYGIYDLNTSFKDGLITLTATREGSGLPMFTKSTAVPGLTIAQLKTIRLFGIMTTGGPAWIDDVNIVALPSLPLAQAGNISTRLMVGTGDNAMIGGFIIAGGEAKKVMVRGLGPSLPLAGHLANPVVELYDASGALLASNDDWTMSPDKDVIVASTIPPVNDLESALVKTLEPGAYTAVLRGTNGGTGIGLVEVYDLAPANSSRLANISTRGFVGSGDNALIGGTIVVGSAPAKFLLRAIGPSLPLAGGLADPVLELHDGKGAVVASNDNWKEAQEMEIEASGLTPPNDLEPAIVRTLAPGLYTVIVRGKDDQTGVALIEAYQLAE